MGNIRADRPRYRCTLPWRSSRIQLRLVSEEDKDWLVQAPIQAVWGLSAPYINGGDVKKLVLKSVLTGMTVSVRVSLQRKCVIY